LRSPPGGCPYCSPASGRRSPLHRRPTGGSPRNSCAGDSGAPLLARTAANALAQVGVLSGGEGVDQCSQTNTTIFTPLNEPIARWVLTVGGTALPPPAAAPRSCGRLRKSLRRARHHRRRAVADRLARRVYRDC
jgi:hypothetical protein